MKKKHLFAGIICLFAVFTVILAVYGLKPYSPAVFGQILPLEDNSLEQTYPGGLHIISWNTGYFSKDADFALNNPDPGIKPVNKDDIRFFLDFLESQPADILLLQETTSDNARLIADSLTDYNIYYANGYRSPAISSILKGKTEKGMTVIAGIQVSECSSRYPGFAEDKNGFKYFFQITSFESSEKGKYWLIINCGTNEYPEEETRKAILKYIPEYMNSIEKDKYYIIFAGDFSAFSDDEIYRLENNLPAGWKMYSASNGPDGRNPAVPYDRLESATWNKVLFLSYQNVALGNIVSHDMKFRKTPGNPVSAIFSIAD